MVHQKRVGWVRKRDFDGAIMGFTKIRDALRKSNNPSMRPCGRKDAKYSQNPDANSGGCVPP
tara:strand:- start:1208 stop:1393 length:186 start_codon:yes stop_codon:yes gene_type:complete